MAIPTLYTYTLQTTIHPEGMTTTTYLLSEFNGLTVPTYASLDISSEVVEAVDMMPGISTIGEATFSFIEDYSTYSEGFWFKVLNGYAELKIEVAEAATVNFFWGRCSRPLSPFQEIKLIGNDIERRGEVTVVDALVRLKEASVADIITMIKANKSTYNTSIPSGLLLDHYFMSLENILGCIQAVANGETYANRETIFIANTDIQFDRTGGGDWVDWETALVCLGNSAGYFGYFESTTDVYWPKKYASGWELLLALVQNFGTVVRRSSENALEFSGRGKDYSNDTYTAPAESQFIPESIPPIRLAFVDHVNSNYNNSYATAGRAWAFGAETLTEAVTIATDTADNLTESQQPDISIPILFFASALPASSTDAPDQWLYSDDGVGALVAIQATRHWDYKAAAYNSTEQEIAANLALYLFRRFGTSQRGYERTYAKIRQGSTNSHLNCQVLRATSINDGVSARDFYAVETRKSLGGLDKPGYLTVVWREV